VLIGLTVLRWLELGGGDAATLADQSRLIATREQRRLRLDEKWTQRDRRLLERAGLSASVQTRGSIARRLTHATVLRRHSGRVLARANWELGLAEVST
jgi:hypothetical protein